MKKVLEQVGFSVTYIEDADFVTMNNAINTFTHRLQADYDSLLYFFILN